MNRPLVMAFVADLYFSTRIESAGEAAGFQVELVEQPGILDTSSSNPAQARTLGEPLKGASGWLLDVVSLRQPVLLVFDINNPSIPWQQWVALLKSVPATRRIPLIAFGSHMQTEVMAAAKDAGADAVLARSAFVSQLPELLRKYARLPDLPGIQDACAQPLSETARQGLALFNAGEYFEAHEVLEHAWNDDTTPGKELYRAILQVAVAYLQIQRGNYAGAVKMFLRMRQWFAPLPDTCRGVDVAGLRMDAGQVEAALRAAGPENTASLDQSLFKPVRFS